MKMIIIFAALFAAVLAAPVDEVEILRQDSDVEAEGFKYGYATSDGSSQDAQGTLKDAGTEDEALEVVGQYQYTGPDNVVYTVTYTAGRAGFVPSGEHIPKADQ